MNDIRRTILWVIFGFSMVLLWDQWQVYNGRPATFFPSGKPAATAKAPAAGASSVPPNTAAASSTLPASAASSTATATAAPGAVPGATVAPAPAAQQVTVTTDTMRVTFDTQGGSIVRTEFLQEKGDEGNNFVLLEDAPERKYVAESGLIGGNFPNHTTPMTFSGDRALKDGANDLTVKFESPDVGGVKLVKTYTFHRGAYDLGVRYDVFNTGTAPVSPQLYLQIVRDDKPLPGTSRFYSTFAGPAVYTEEHKYQKVKFEDVQKNKADFQKESSDGYVAMVQHYFASAWILPNGVKRDIFVRELPNSGGNAAPLFAVGMIDPLNTIAPGQSKAVEAKFFAGPQIETMLEQVAPGLELVKDYGWVTIIAKPLYWLLRHIHALLHNWGWSIMALVLVIKIAFYWLQAKGYESMAKMKAINPKIQAMRERLKDNPQQMQQEMMRIYREEKVNPMGGCFPIMIQIPVFIALYWVLLSSVEMRGAPWVGWIHDLAAPDPYFILPVVMTLTSLLQTALNPAPPDPMQAKMMWIMPLVFSVMFFFFPAGLVLYWITNNLLSIAQQWLINYRMGVPPQFNMPKFK
jgi:YidC/Oxa1 family membrane protein insertase